MAASEQRLGSKVRSGSCRSLGGSQAEGVTVKALLWEGAWHVHGTASMTVWVGWGE